MKGYFLVQFWYLLNLALNTIVKTMCKAIFLSVYQMRHKQKHPVIQEPLSLFLTLISIPLFPCLHLLTLGV